MAIVAAGATVGVGALVSGALPTTFTTIGEVKSISGPEITSSMIDVTHLASTGREYLPSPIPDSGKLSMSMWLKPTDTQHKLLRDSVQAGTKLGFKVTLSGGANSKFIGAVESFKINVGSVDEAVTADVELQITGAITWSDT